MTQGLSEFSQSSAFDRLRLVFRPRPISFRSQSDWSVPRKARSLRVFATSVPWCRYRCRYALPSTLKEAVLQVLVRDNNVDQALRALKKNLQREGVFREMKRRRSYEKPSERRAREKSESIRRARKLARKQAQREGLIARKPRPQRAAAGGRR